MKQGLNLLYNLSPKEMNKICIQSTPKKFGTHLSGKKARKRGGIKRK